MKTMSYSETSKRLPPIAGRAFGSFVSVHIYFYFSVLLVRNWFEPFIGGVLSGNLESQMSKPAVGGSSVSMLYACRDVDDRSRKNLLLETSLGIIGRCLFRPYFFGLAECRPGLGPACIERNIVRKRIHNSTCTLITSCSSRQTCLIAASALWVQKKSSLITVLMVLMYRKVIWK